MIILTKFRSWISILALCLWTLPSLAQEDWTSSITNPDFNGNMNGWTTYAPNGGNVQMCPSEPSSAEYWIGTASNGAFNYYQDLKGLPNGKYKVRAKMWYSTDRIAGSINDACGVYAANGSGEIFAHVTKDTRQDGRAFYETTSEIIVFNHTLRVGVKNRKVMTARWFGVDKIELIKTSDATAQELAEAREKALQPSLHDYLSFTSTGPCRIHLVHTQTNDRFDFQYSIDDCKTWIDYLAADQIHIENLETNGDGYDKLTNAMKNRFIDISNGKRVYFRAKGRNGALSSGNDQKQANEKDPSLYPNCQEYCRYQFMADGTGEIYASGNVMSILDSLCVMDEVPAVGFSRLFYNLKHLRSTPRLTAKIANKWCYEDLFQGTSVTNEAEVYATTRGDSWNSDIYAGVTGQRGNEENYTWLRMTNTQPYLSTIKLHNGNLYNIQYSYDGTNWHNTWSGDPHSTEMGECPSCHGHGFFEEVCKTCNGNLQVTCTHCTKGKQSCPTCNGAGKASCTTCQGFGYFECDVCDGEGIIDCDQCNHTGKVNCTIPGCDGGIIKCMTCNSQGTITCTYSESIEVDLKGLIGKKTATASCNGNGYLTWTYRDGLGVSHTRYFICPNCSKKARGDAKITPPNGANRGSGNITCPTCNRAGNLGDCPTCVDGKVDCPKCSGAGQVTCNAENCNEGQIDCQDCDGGLVQCTTCNGKKTITCTVCNGSKKEDCFACLRSGKKFIGCPSCGGKGIDNKIEGITKGDGIYRVNESTPVTIVLGQSSEKTEGKSNRVYFRTNNADNSAAAFSDVNFMQFEISGGVYASGNVMSLIKKENYTTLSAVPGYAFYHLFEGCDFLQASPKMTATNLGVHCYEGMYKNCIGLWQSSELPATTLTEGCYKEMFYGCSTLHQITSSFNTWDQIRVDGEGNIRETNATYNWVAGVHRSKADRFVNNNINLFIFDAHHIPCDDEVQWYTGSVEFLTFTATAANNTKVKLIANGTPNAIKLCYKMSNNANWYDYTIGQEILLNKDQSVQFRAGYKSGPTAAKEYFYPHTNLAFSKSDEDYYRFVLDGGKVAVSGNILSLLSYDCSNDEVPEYAFCHLFRRETASGIGEKAYLTSAPKLPGTILGQYAYSKMFYACSALEVAPELPATVINKGCYQAMFRATGIKLAPALPAETLADNCYYQMFYSCKKLTSAPELNATTLATGCYRDMFNGCIKLETAPELHVENLKSRCYQQMFYGCTALTEAPALPSEHLANYCYYGMFQGDTLLTSSPVLPAQDLLSHCYSNMFNGCKNLVKITVAFDKWTNSKNTAVYTENWVQGVSDMGTFFCPEELPKVYGYSRVPLEELDETKQWRIITTPYICFMAKKPGSSVLLRNNGDVPSVALQYSQSGDVNDWKPVIFSEPIAMPNVGDIVLFRAQAEAEGQQKYPECETCGGSGKVPAGGGLLKKCSTCDGTGEDRTKPATTVTGNSYTKNETFSTSATDFYQFAINDEGAVELSGDVMSLIRAEYSRADKIFKEATEVKEYGFYGLFKDCANMIGGIDFSATDIKAHGCQSMFDGCKSLSFAPEFNNTQVYTTSCFERMFAGCESMKAIPTLPAMNTAASCFKEMFQGCKSLNGKFSLTDFYIGSGSTSCYEGMFEDCTSLTETATFRPQSETGNLAERCYYAMYRGCTKLTTAHTMNQRDMSPSCYESMFEGCTSLTEMPEIYPTGTKSDPIKLTTACFRNMFKDCTAMTVARTYTTGAMANNCFEGMFEGCTGLVEAPLLTQQNLAESCYKRMFANCTGLEIAPDLPAKTLAHGCYYEMFNGCSKLRYIDISFSLNQPNNESNVYWSASQTKDEPDYTYHWVEGVAPYGIFMCPEKLVELQKFDISHIPEGWATEDNGNYLCFTGLAPYNNRIRFEVHGNNVNSIALKYSTDKREWHDYDMNEQSELFTGGKIYFKATKKYGSFSNNEENYITVSRITADTDDSNNDYMCAVSGNVMSLIDPTMEEEEVKDYSFYRLFSGLGLRLQSVDGLELPATTVGDYGYADMFDGCTYLKDAEHGAETAPELPATKIGKFAYENLFSGWKNLKKAPNLPAKELAEGCYNSLFDGCSSLDEIHVSFEKWFDNEDNICTYNWVRDVVDKGEFYCKANLLSNAIDHWGDADQCKAVYGFSRVPKDADHGDAHKWVIILDVDMDYDYNTDMITLGGGKTIRYMTYDPSSEDEITTETLEKSGSLYDIPFAPVWDHEVVDLDSVYYCAASYLGTTIPSSLCRSVVRTLPIYAFPKYYGYCLAGDAGELQRALYYAEKASSKKYPVRIFVENNGNYTLEDGVKNLIVSDYVSLIGESVEGVNIIHNESDAAPLKINGNHAYLQDMTISNNAGYSFYNYGTSNVLNVAMPTGQKYRTSTTDRVIEPAWTTGKDWSGCAKVDYVIRNGGAFNVVIQDRAYKEDTLLLEMDDKYAMTNCNTFYLMDGVNSTFTVRRANDRGAFGPMFAFNKFQNVAIPTDGEGNEVAQYEIPTIQLNSKGYSSFYYEAPDFEPGKPHRLRAINASAFVAACEGIGEPVKLYHINDLDVIPSGTGVILFGHPNDIVTFYEDRDADVSAFDELLEPENNQLRGIVKDSKKYPEYNSMTNWVSEGGFDYWKPGVSNRFYGISGETFMKLSATGRMKEYKAFFDFGASSGAASYRMAFGKWSDFDITIPEREGNSTGIKTICQSENPVETNITYNILGQRTSALKGLLVKNGKVILQK